MSTEQICENCFFVLKQPGPQFWCRRFPPTGQLVQMMQPAAVLGGPPQVKIQPMCTFPPVMANMSCGEFVPNPGGIPSVIDLNLN